MKKKNYLIILGQLATGFLLDTSSLAQTEPTSHSPTSGYTVPVSYLIEDIQVIGIQSLDKKAIVDFSGLQPGDTIEIPGPAIAEAIQRLWQQKLIQDIAIYSDKVTDDRVVLTFNITESPRLSDYSFEGIKKKEQENLIDKLVLAKGKIVTEELIKNTQKAIREYCLKEGYCQTSVTINSVPDPTRLGYVQLKIKIDKGKKLKINAIHLVGNQHISSQDLKSQMRHTQEKPRFTLVKDLLKQVFTLQPIRKGGILLRPFRLKESWNYLRKHVILFPSTFDLKKFEEDKKYLVSYYQSQGFRDAIVTEHTVSNEEDNLLDIWMKVEEGAQYRVGDIRWVGNHLYDDSTLNQILKIKRGDLYNPSLIHQRIYNNPEEQDNIASLYVEDGYYFFRANVVEVGLRENTVDIEIRIKEGPQTTINKVWIRGNKLTQDHVIRRELRTLPGDKFSGIKLQRSLRELKQLNIFDPNINVLTVPNLLNETVDIEYKVKERPKFEIRASGGWGNRGLIISGILGIDNFSLSNLWKSRLPTGGGQTLVIIAESDRKGYNNFSIQFIDPWLGSKKPRQFHFTLNKASEKEISSVGGNVGLGTRLVWPDDYMSLKASLDYHHHNYKDYDLLGNQKQYTGVVKDLSSSISIERDSTGPNPIYPKEGSKLGLHTRFTPPWSWLSGSNPKNNELYGMGESCWKEYHQWMLDSSFFFRLVENLVLNIRGHLGVIGKFPSQKSIGPFERFFLGGTNPLGSSSLIRGKEYISLRGYAEDYFAPEDRVTGYKGGVIYDKFVAELRYPIIEHYLTYVYAVAFAEGANTWVQYEEFNLFSMNRSVGVGLRFYLPFIVGTTIGFDWGYGFDKKLADKKNNELHFHFSIGMNLR